MAFPSLTASKKARMQTFIRNRAEAYRTFSEAAEMGVSEREPHEEWDKPCASPGRRGMRGLRAGLERFAWRARRNDPRSEKIPSFGCFAPLFDNSQVGYP